MNLVTIGNMPSVAKTFNYILYKCKLSVNTFYAPNAHNVCKHRIIISFTNSLYRVQPVAADCIIGWDVAMPLMQCPPYQYTGTHFADLRRMAG